MPENKKPLTDQSNNPLHGVKRKNFFKLSRFYLILIGFCLLSSCMAIGTMITQTPGFYSGFERLPELQRKKVVVVNNKNTLPPLIDSNTYAITAKHLAQLVKEKAPCVVYLWSPHCGATACISIRAFNQFCEKNNYNAIVISEYFDFEMLDIESVAPSSVFAINHWHYGTDYCNKYVRRFQESFFKIFNTEYNAKYSHKYIYYNGKTLSTEKPASFGKYPWE